jgi:hypothetical protein
LYFSTLRALFLAQTYPLLLQIFSSYP